MERNATHAGDEELILALAAGATVAEAAEKAGVSERTAYRRRKDADFLRAVNETRCRLFDNAGGRLASLANSAVATLERLMESEKPTVALGAAKAVLELAPRLRASTELEERMNRLEDQLDEKTEPNRTPTDDDELVLALAAGAEQVDTGEQTAEDPLADADFRRAVSRARGWLFHTAAGGLASLAGKAADILERLMQSDSPSVARRAAQAVLVLGPRFRESTELEERMNRLEEQVDNMPEGKAVIVDNGWYGHAST